MNRPMSFGVLLRSSNQLEPTVKKIAVDTAPKMNAASERIDASMRKSPGFVPAGECVTRRRNGTPDMA